MDSISALEEQLKAGFAHHRAGRLGEAEAFYRRVLTENPHQPLALRMLALILMEGPNRQEAEGLLLRLLEIDPGSPLTLYTLGHLYQDKGDRDAAIAFYRRSAGIKDTGEYTAATAATAGMLEIAELVAAERAYRALLDLGADNVVAIENLANVLSRLHRDREALAMRNRLTSVQGVVRKGRADQAEATILLLGGVGADHILMPYVFDPDLFATLTLFLLSPDQPGAPLGSVDIGALAGADLIVSLLGEADRHGGQFEPVTECAKRLGKPLLNPPSRVARTGRDQAEALFGGIPGLVVPRVRRMERDELLSRPAAVTGPLLIRPVGVHGGKGVVLIQTQSDLTEYMEKTPPEAVLLTDFHDFKDDRGCYRKYRFIFVDRQPFAYHLAIGETWLVHYWRAEMGRSAWKKQEEEAFLTDWRSVFGRRAVAAVEQVAQRLDLDYGGMDCSILPDGSVLLFEANACMVAHLDDDPVEFPYKHAAVPRIREAVTRMIRERVRPSDGL